MFFREPEKDWLKKPLIFLISLIVHAAVLILLIQALTPVTIINFPVRVTSVVITPREGLPPAPVGKGEATGSVSGGAGGRPGEKKEMPSLKERLGLLEKEAGIPFAQPRPPGPMPLPPFNLKPPKEAGAGTFTLRLPAPEAKKEQPGAKERSRPGSAHDYWRYVLATEPGKEPKKGGGTGLAGEITTTAGQVPRVAVEGPGYDLSPWAQEVVARLQKNWQIAASRSSLEKGSLRLLIGIDKKGEINFMRIVASSQKAAFDRAALDAVNLSLPLPQLPPEFPSETIELTIIFECEESRG